MSKFKAFLKEPQTVIGILIILIIVLAALFAPIIRPGNPLFSVGRPLQRPGSEFLFGTDHMGRDVFAMIIWGTRVSLLFALGASAISLLLGVLLGAIAGFVGGIVDDILSRFFELFYIIPRTFLCILMVAVFGSSIRLMIVIVGITIWPTNARIMRAQVLMLKNRGYVQAGVVAGSGRLKLIATHIIPNGIGPVISNSTMQMAQAILMEATLSFLGLGDPNVASWGQILHAGQKYLISSPWIITYAGIAISIMLLAFSMLGNSFHKVMNSKQIILQ